MTFSFTSLPDNYRAVVIGATGGIGSAFARHLESDPRCAEVIGLSRSSTPAIDITDEASVEAAATFLASQGDGTYHLIIDATGILSDEVMQPEKALKQLEPKNMLKNFQINAMGPALMLKHFPPLLPRAGKSFFALLSAKVGSISDNQIGGWHSYRAAKAAMNMFVKGAAIEIGRKYKDAVILSLHPGTVATRLSGPFSGNVSHDIFTPEDATQKLLKVMDDTDASESGMLKAYDGSVISF